MPTCDVRLKKRTEFAVFFKKIAISNDAITRGRKIDMRVKTGVEKRDRDTFSGETFVRVETKRC